MRKKLERILILFCWLGADESPGCSEGQSESQETDNPDHEMAVLRKKMEALKRAYKRSNASKAALYDTIENMTKDLGE